MEEFHLLALDSQSQVLREVLVTRGLLNSSLVHPREVFRAAIAEAAAGIILHGSVQGLPAEEAVGVALTTSGLQYRLSDGELLVFRGRSQ